MVPSSAAADAVQARWKVDGTLRISTRDGGQEKV